MKITVNGDAEPAATAARLEASLDRAFAISPLEFWISSARGQSLCMLRQGLHAWPMYLRHNDGDSGFVSQGDMTVPGTAEFTLSNGQVDEYPLALCLPLERCREAIRFFFESDGGMAPDVVWLES